MANGITMKRHIGHGDVLFVTLDTLRFDVARNLFEMGRLPNLAAVLPPHGWERRHSPASFTYAAHHAFFAGFLPTPIPPGPHPRLFASRFGGSETTTGNTFVFDEATLPEALRARDYRTICIGGTGFFNPTNALGRVLPSLFDEAHWSPELGVTDPDSPANQVDRAIDAVTAAGGQRVFCFINFSALHQPNWFFASETPPADGCDTLESHGAALVAIDRHFARLLNVFRRRGTGFGVVCSDHGTTYGEDGYRGHRLAHPVVWEVPYAEFEW